MKSFLLLFLSVAVLQAANIDVASLDLSVIQAAHDASTTHDDDVLVLPVGPITTWAGTLNISKSITLQGRGIGNTIINDNAPNPGSGATAILIKVTLKAASQIPPINSGVTRITGIEFRPTRVATGEAVIEPNGINTDGGRFRCDNCKFASVNMQACIWPKGVLGVADHNEVILAGNGNFFCYVYHQNWNGGTNSDKSWSDGPHWGTDQFWFMEDNTISYASGASGCVDSYRGARWVFRYNNSVTNANLSAHGTESSGRTRGTRAVEVYNNHFTVTAGNSRTTVLNLRSGAAVMHHNTSDGFSAGGFGLRADDDRLAGNFKAFGAADGDAPWDYFSGNPKDFGTATGGGSLSMTDTSKTWSPNPDKWKGYVVRQVKLTGTATSATGTTPSNLTMTDNTKAWTLNQWTRYIVKDVTTGKWGYINSNDATTISYTGFGPTTTCKFNPTDVYQFINASYIASSTANSITCYAPVIGPAVTFASGESYQINQINESLDAPGRGTCDDLGGAANPAPQTLNQTTEPVYEWLNTHNGSTSATLAQVGNIGYIGSNYPAVFRKDEHFFNNTVKPALDYTPFVHPHPLVSGAATPTPTPSPPVNLRIQGKKALLIRR